MTFGSVYAFDLTAIHFVLFDFIFLTLNTASDFLINSL